MSLLPELLPAGAIELRRALVADLDELEDAVGASFAELHQWMIWAREMPRRAELEAFLAAREEEFDHDESWSYFLRERDGLALVGAGSLSERTEPDVLEIGYWVRTDRTGRGYATATARALTDAAFAFVAGVERVEIQMDRANPRSAAVPRRLGFRLEREVERERHTPGQSGRHLIWSVSRETWGSTG